MAFYEGDGPISVESHTNYEEQLNDLCKNCSGSQKEMILSFARTTKLPYSFIKELVKTTANRTIDHEWQSIRTHNGYKTVLAPSIAVGDISKLIPFFNAVQKIGLLKIKDIHALEYSIFSFNSDSSNLTSLSKSVKAFNNARTELYHIALEYIDTNGNKTPFGLNISTHRCKVGSFDSRAEKMQSLLEYWFPKFDQYFHKSKDAPSDAAIADFVQQCRISVRGRRYD